MTTAKIYTKSGDKGSTSLVDGKKVFKSDVRIETYGTVDELNSFLGLFISELEGTQIEAHKTILSGIQNQLFNLGSRLACSDQEIEKSLPSVTDAQIFFLENQIDLLTEQLSPLREFILPGGSRSSALAHVCRTITRRAERHCVALMQSLDAEHALDPLLLKFLNRLSDYFFVLARHCNMLTGQADEIWRKEIL